MSLNDETEALRQEVKRLRKALAGLTPDLRSLLKRRGFEIFTSEPPEDLLLPSEKHIEGFFGLMKKYSFRLFLRDVIKHQDLFTLDDVTRYSTQEVTADYMEYLRDVGLAESADNGFRLKKRPIKSFGATLEWFVAEIFRRDLQAEAVWGIKFKGQKVGGDYDLIAKINGSLLYMEVKSSPPKQIYDTEISAFLDRVGDLAPEVAVFFMDTELRMKDKIVPMFEEELKKRHPKPPEVERMFKELFQISGRTYIINSKGSVTANIEAAMRWYFRRKAWQ